MLCMQAYIDSGDLAAVRSTMKDMHAYGVKAGPTILTQLLRSCTLEARPAAAKAAAIRIWKRMEALEAPLTVESYNAMLGVSLLGDPEFAAHALCAVDEMRQRGLPLRTDTLNTVMNVAVQNEDFVQVCALATFMYVFMCLCTGYKSPRLYPAVCYLQRTVSL